MTWQPISLKALEEILAEQLQGVTHEERDVFARAAIRPAKWRLSPGGDEGGGFWAVAVMDNRVLWYNDIEEGFNVSRFVETGSFPRLSTGATRTNCDGR